MLVSFWPVSPEHLSVCSSRAPGCAWLRCARLRITLVFSFYWNSLVTVRPVNSPWCHTSTSAAASLVLGRCIYEIVLPLHFHLLCPSKMNQFGSDTQQNPRICQTHRREKHRNVKISPSLVSFGNHRIYFPLPFCPPNQFFGL